MAALQRQQEKAGHGSGLGPRLDSSEAGRAPSRSQGFSVSHRVESMHAKHPQSCKQHALCCSFLIVFTRLRLLIAFARLSWAYFLQLFFEACVGCLGATI